MEKNTDSKISEDRSQDLAKTNSRKSTLSSYILTWLCGEDIVLVQILFLKLFTMIYIIAFASIYVQIPGLYGKDGLLPVNNYLEKVESHFGSNKYNILPTIFWLSKSINHYLIQIFPTLTGFQAEENFFHVICLANILLGIGVLFDNNCKIFFKFWTFFVMWGSYLSIFLVGQTFLSFQWDILILETGFLAMFFVPNKKDGYFVVDQLSVASRELLRWLMFRFMFSNGVVKLLSGDQTWWSLSALHYHFESQPLPTSLSKWWHYLPDFIKKFGVAGTFIVEIFIPIFFYSPIRTIRIFSALVQIPFQLTLIATGNYNWFNIHTILLCIPLLDDRFITQYMPNWIKRCIGISHVKTSRPSIQESPIGKKLSWLFSVLCIAIVALLFGVYFPFDLKGSIRINFDMRYLKNTIINSYFLIISVYLAIIFAIFNLIRYTFRSTSPLKVNVFVKLLKFKYSLIFFCFVFCASLDPFFAGMEANINHLSTGRDIVRSVQEKFQNFHIVNSYGLFRVMTGVGGRPEIIIQGSYNGQEWLDYDFYYKPGKLDEKSKRNVPHQPRLDWQMWFAALSDINNQPWLVNLMGRLFSNSPSVLKLIKNNPFAKKPPNYLRIKRFKYAFAALNSSDEWQILNRSGEDYLPSIHRDEQILRNYLQSAGFQPISLKETYPVHPWQDISILNILFSLLIINILWNFFKYRKG